jgi:acetyl esterase/lipase
MVVAGLLVGGFGCKGDDKEDDRSTDDTVASEDDAERPASWDDDDEGLGITRARPAPARGRPGAAGPAIERNVRYNARFALDVYKPTGAGPHPALIAIHGGGWRKGSRTQYGPVVAPMTSQGFVVFAIDYALSAPGRPTWRGNFDDVRDAVRWVRDHAAKYGVDPNRVAAVGESAGGHLSAMLGVYPDEPGRTSARVQAVVDFFGPAELVSCAAESRQGAGAAIAQMIGGNASQKPNEYADASPVTHVAADSAPMLIFHGTADQLVPPSQSDKLDAALAGKGVAHQLVRVAGAGHVYVGKGFVYGRHNYASQITAFLNEAFARH